MKNATSHENLVYHDKHKKLGCACLIVRLFVRPTAVVNGLKGILLLWCLNENRLFLFLGISLFRKQ